MNRKNKSAAKNTVKEKDLNKIVSLLETIQYGSVTLVIQDGKLIQIERNEKVRII